MRSGGGGAAGGAGRRRAEQERSPIGKRTAYEQYSQNRAELWLLQTHVVQRGFGLASSLSRMPYRTGGTGTCTCMLSLCVRSRARLFSCQTHVYVVPVPVWLCHEKNNTTKMKLIQKFMRKDVDRLHFI